MNTRDLVLSALFAAIIVALGLLPPIPIGISVARSRCCWWW